MPQWFTTAARDIWSSVYPYLPTLGVALAILVGGWLIAYILKSVTYAGLKRTHIDNRAARFFGLRAGGVEGHRTERFISKAVYYIALAFVFVAFFSQLKITAVTDPIVGALSGITAAIPNLLKALVIGVIGFLLAKLARRIVVAAVDKTGLSDRLARMSSEGAERRAATKAAERSTHGESKLAHTLGEVAYWVVLAIVAVPVLEALKVGALAQPLSEAFAAVATYLPRIAAAVLLLAIGYLAGRLLRGLTVAICNRIGVDNLMTRIGGGRVLKGQSLGGIIGTIVMAFVLLHFAISAVGRLGIPEISQPLGHFLESIYAYLPRLLVGGFVLAIGIVVARLAGNVSGRLLAAMGFNTLMANIGIYKVAPHAHEQEKESRAMVDARRRGERDNPFGEDRFLAGAEERQHARTPADVGGIVVALVIGLIFVRQALFTMELSSFGTMLDAFIGFLPQVLVAAVVVGAGLWAGNWAHRRLDEFTASTDDRLLRVMGVVAHVAIVVFAVMMAAQQLGVASSLIGTAFALLLGAVCLAGALAFGLGGREVAGDILKREYSRRRRPGPAE